MGCEKVPESTLFEYTEIFQLTLNKTAASQEVYKVLSLKNFVAPTTMSYLSNHNDHNVAPIFWLVHRYAPARPKTT